jgi:hypothetical protein
MGERKILFKTDPTVNFARKWSSYNKDEYLLMVLGNSGKGILKISVTESYCQVVIGRRSIGR